MVAAAGPASSRSQRERVGFIPRVCTTVTTRANEPRRSAAAARPQVRRGLPWSAGRLGWQHRKHHAAHRRRAAPVRYRQAPGRARCSGVLALGARSAQAAAAHSTWTLGRRPATRAPTHRDNPLPAPVPPCCEPRRSRPAHPQVLHLLLAGAGRRRSPGSRARGSGCRVSPAPATAPTSATRFASRPHRPGALGARPN